MSFLRLPVIENDLGALAPFAVEPMLILGGLLDQNLVAGRVVMHRLGLIGLIVQGPEDAADLVKEEVLDLETAAEVVHDFIEVLDGQHVLEKDAVVAFREAPEQEPNLLERHEMPGVQVDDGGQALGVIGVEIPGSVASHVDRRR